jgi:hypothetical protein
LATFVDANASVIGGAVDDDGSFQTRLTIQNTENHDGTYARGITENVVNAMR